MTLPTSGPLSLQDIEDEFGGTGSISLSEYYKGGNNVPSNVSEGSGRTIPTSGRIDISDFYGASNAPAAVPFTLTVNSNTEKLSVHSAAIAAGWDGQGFLTVNIGGVYIWTDNTANPALAVTNTYPNGVRINNYGYIMGRGGDNEELGRYPSLPNNYQRQAESGGVAILIASQDVTIDNKTSGYILGGGGAGSPANGTSANPSWGGGGGAGGGAGGYDQPNSVLSLGGSIGNLGDAGPTDFNSYPGTSNAEVRAGGGGHGGIYWQDPNNSARTVINGAAGGGRRIPPNDTAGVSRTAVVSSTVFRGGDGGTAGNDGAYPVANSSYVPAAGGGGGGYGAQGGQGYTASAGFYNSPGLAGRAILATYTYTLTGTTSQIYGNT
jgi:hypothetical protein